MFRRSNTSHESLHTINNIHNDEEGRTLTIKQGVEWQLVRTGKENVYIGTAYRPAGAKIDFIETRSCGDQGIFFEFKG